MRTATAENTQDAELYARLKRFLATCLGFAVFETALLAIFGPGLVDLGHGSFLGDVAVILAAALGYLALGALSGSAVSFFAMSVPILVALALGGTATTADESTPLYVVWVSLTIYIFTPAWLLGLVAGFVARYRSDAR